MFYALIEHLKYRPGLHKYLNVPRFQITCGVAVLVTQYMPRLVFTVNIRTYQCNNTIRTTVSPLQSPDIQVQELRHQTRQQHHSHLRKIILTYVLPRRSPLHLQLLGQNAK